MPRALLIDPFEQSLKVLDFEGNFEVKNELIGVSCGTVVMLKEDVMMWADDEGRLKEGQRCFNLGDWLFAGKTLIMGLEEDRDQDGDQAEVDLGWPDVFTLMSNVEWLPEGTDYSPGEPIIMFVEMGGEPN